MSRYAILEEIQKLDPVADHQRIVFLSTCFDFPFDTTRALEFALFRTFAVPGVSAVLDHTGEFQKRAQRRYDDTDIIVSELMEWGYTSERGQRALARMNEIHARFAITNDKFLYVLSTFVYEPIRWNARFGWRVMCEKERLAMFHFWREVGIRMHIKNIPEDYAEFERFNIEYEREHFRFAPLNKSVGTATREMFVSWFPSFLAPITRSAIHAALDDKLIESFGFPRPSAFMRWMVPIALRVKARVVRWLPPRRKPRLRTMMPHRSHPDGYVIEQLGPPAAH
jgi:hypothetical protein